MKIEEIKGLEEYLTQFPVFEYQLIESRELFFEPRVRIICQQECERFGTTWACPPGVGTLEECERRCPRLSVWILLFKRGRGQGCSGYAGASCDKRCP